MTKREKLEHEIYVLGEIIQYQSDCVQGDE